MSVWQKIRMSLPSIFILMLPLITMHARALSHEKDLAPIFKGIGEGYFKADTQNPKAQVFFNQGMVFFYGFDYMAAIRSFKAAIKLDNKCARCQYALALSLGSISNAFIKGDEITKAQMILDRIKPRDSLTEDLVDALKLRYRGIRKEKNINTANRHCVQGQIELPQKNNIAFSDAMFALTKKYPANQTVLTLFAFSVFNTDNWDFYDGLINIRPYALMMKEATQKALSINPKNVGAIHYYIHVTEWSRNPKASLKYAKNLASLAPLAEHLVHMPTHIYLRLGLYNKAVKENLRSVRVYKEYENICQAQGYKPVVNFLNQHNYDFLFASSIFAGRADIAYQTALDVMKQTPVAWIKKSVWIQRYYALPYFAIAHFGLWDKLKAFKAPSEKTPYMRAAYAYAQALHHNIKGDEKAYQHYLAMFNRARQLNNDYPPAKQAFANNLSLAKEVLLANNALKKKDFNQAITHWQNAVLMQRAGGDPPPWYFPVKQGLGYAFLKANKPYEAIAAFQSDLNAHPNNGWSLFGIEEAYQKLGLKNKARQYLNRFKSHWAKKAIQLPIRQGSDIFLP